jgi:uncharacterized protein (TIGR03067 family)
MRQTTWTTRFAAVVVLTMTTAVAAAAQDKTADELKKLEGGWMVVAAEQRGKSFDAIKGGGLVIEGSTFFLRTAAGNEFKGTIRIDPSKSPRQLDFIHEKGGAVWEAIYTVTDDMFRMNYVEGGGRDARPTLFATSADSGGTVIVMSRLAQR